MIIEIIQLFISTSLYLIIGYGLTSLFLNNEQKKLGLVTSFWVGILIVSLFGFCLGMAKLSYVDYFLFNQISTTHLLIFLSILLFGVVKLYSSFIAINKVQFITLIVLLISVMFTVKFDIPSVKSEIEILESLDVFSSTFGNNISYSRVQGVGFNFPVLFIKSIMNIDVNTAAKLFSINIISHSILTALIFYQKFRLMNNKISNLSMVLALIAIGFLASTYLETYKVLIITNIILVWWLLLEKFLVSPFLMAIILIGLAIFNVNAFFVAISVGIGIVILSGNFKKNLVYLFKIIITALIINPFILGFIK